jgi:ribonucleoside-triphosphate reductase
MNSSTEIKEKVQFKLPKSFVQKYSKLKVPFGFNGLGELVYRRTYSRKKADGSNEQWFETIERVINGTYSMQKRWVLDRGLFWSEHKALESAKEMYDRMFYMKFLPPGRGLWAMGSKIIEEKELYLSLNNCAFISTENIDKEFSKPFIFLMDCSMLGVGVGFDTKGAEKLIIKAPKKNRQKEIYQIADTREGWVTSVEILLDSYFKGNPEVEFDYSLIRKEGEPIKTFGGISSGPQPLIDLHQKLREILNKEIDEPISITTIVDIMNLIGKCVVSGNVRRSAEIVFGDSNSEEYLDLKNYQINPTRESFGWSSNNSVFCERGMNYEHVAERTRLNGEPGYVWLENMRRYGRMKDLPDNKDYRAMGLNPCSEQVLESYEVCNLVETFPNNHKDLNDYLRTLKFAYLYAKTVSLGETHWVETNRVLLRNRRIGCSMSGIVQFITDHSLNELRTWLMEGYQKIQEYDTIYSEWLCIPKSIRKTSIKPSGSVSLLAGATPGVHFPISEYYIRRIRLGKNSELVKPLQKAGYKVEPCFGSETTTVVVDIPVHVGKKVKSDLQVSMWEKLALTAFMQRYWADNSVSVTITFNPDTEGRDISNALNYYQYHLKAVSFLPIKKDVYQQMPYESITKEQYDELISKLKKIDFSKVDEQHDSEDKFCDGEACLLEKK